MGFEKIEPSEKFKRGWRQVLGEKDYGLYEATTGMIVAANIKYDSDGNAIEIGYSVLHPDDKPQPNGIGYGKGEDGE